MSKAATSRKEAMRRFLEEVVGIPVNIPLSYEETYRGYSDTLDAERVIHNIPKDQLEVLVCLHLGIKPVDIVKILHYSNIVRYYNVSAKLRRVFLQRKALYLDYT